jgi:hypothetical protein
MIMPIPRFYVHLYIHSGEIPQVQGKLTDVILDQTQVRMEMHFFFKFSIFLLFLVQTFKYISEGQGGISNTLSQSYLLLLLPFVSHCHVVICFNLS